MEKPQIATVSESLEELQKSIEESFQAIQIQWEDVVRVASRAKKSTGGGLCQLTPWHLRSAVLNSSGNKCAKMLAAWANRWARGDYDSSLGAIFSMSRLIPIYKDWKTDDVRRLGHPFEDCWEELLRIRSERGSKD